MKSLIKIAISFLFISKSFGQIDFESDLTSIKKNSTLSYLIDSTFKLNKTFDFEFRLTASPSLVSYNNVFILTQKNKIWSARSFEYNGSQKRKLSEIKVNQSKLDSLWKRLVANQVLTLPTQDSIKSKMKIFVADTSYALEEYDTYRNISIMDGTTYHFEMATRNKRHSYEYHCPQGYLKYYPNVEELYRAFVIIVMVKKYLGFSLEVC